MRAGYEKRMLRVLDYIHENPGADLSLDTLSDIAAMSRFHWHRVFRAVTGETLSEAVRRICLHRAAFALVQTDRGLQAIAAEAGYRNVRSFARAFTGQYGLSPTAFRERGALTAPHPPQRKGSSHMFDIEIRQISTHRLAAYDHTGPYSGVSKAFEKLSATIAARNLWPSVKGMAGVFYDDPSQVPAAQLRSHAGFILAEEVEVPEGLEEVTLREGRAAVLRYQGPYSGLPQAYDHLYGTWLPQSGEEAADASSFEVYLNSPMDTAPDDLLTELHLPLQ